MSFAHAVAAGFLSARITERRFGARTTETEIREAERRVIERRTAAVAASDRREYTERGRHAAPRPARLTAAAPCRAPDRCGRRRPFVTRRVSPYGSPAGVSRRPRRSTSPLPSERISSDAISSRSEGGARREPRRLPRGRAPARDLAAVSVVVDHVQGVRPSVIGRVGCPVVAVAAVELDPRPPRDRGQRRGRGHRDIRRPPRMRRSAPRRTGAGSRAARGSPRAPRQRRPRPTRSRAACGGFDDAGPPGASRRAARPAGQPVPPVRRGGAAARSGVSRASRPGIEASSATARRHGSHVSRCSSYSRRSAGERAPST